MIKDTHVLVFLPMFRFVSSLAFVRSLDHPQAFLVSGGGDSTVS